MEDLRIKAKNLKQKMEIVGLFENFGYKQNDLYSIDNDGLMVVFSYKDGFIGDVLDYYYEDSDHKEITIEQLRDLVVLKRNDPNDATHIGRSGSQYYKGSNFYFWTGFKWVLSVNPYNCYKMKIITKEKPMKEYLEKQEDGSYKLVLWDGFSCVPECFIEVPKGADTLAGDGTTNYFWKHGVGKKGNMLIGCGESLSRYSDWDDCGDSAQQWLEQINDSSFDILWQREPIDKNEQVLRGILEGGQDNVNQPLHYNKGGIECINAIQSSMTHEAFCGYLKGNVQKYMWRYENKGGVESLKKAQWYLNKLIEVQNANSCKD